MTLVYQPLIRFLGLYPSGDLGPLTIYTSKRKGIVYFAKAPPKELPTVLQRRVRARLTLAAWLWTMLPETARQAWLLAARKANLRITGYNLYCYWVMTDNLAAIKTIERQTGIQLT